MLRRSFVAAACVVFGASAAWAQDASVLGRDDIEFAETLSERGFPDLADRLVRIIETQNETYFGQVERDSLRSDSLDPEIERLSERRAAFIRAWTIHLHALTFERGSDRRVRLCEQALVEFETVDLDWYCDDPPLWLFRAYVYAGLCLDEMGKPKEAVGNFDRVVCLRQSYGDADAKTGVYPIPSGARDIVELVCDAVLQKTVVLRDAKKLDAVVAAGKDYFATMPRPFDAPSAMSLAKALGEAQFAIGDAKGAVETARRMIREDPDGLGAQWGRELLERGAK